MKSTVCIAEDRASCEPAVKLLILSLNAHSPGTKVSLFFPPATPDFISWIAAFPSVKLEHGCATQGCGWNVKPKVIQYLLDSGFEEVIWIDSDILVTRNIWRVFADLDPGTLVITEHTLAEERDDRNGRRARMWGFPVGRTFPTAFSSGVVRATRCHARLIERWWELLQCDSYLSAQNLGWYERPVHLLGDQDVLTALLTSSEFSNIPFRVLRRGFEIIQFDGVWGYSVPERIVNLLGWGPTFIHAGAAKPWLVNWRSNGVRDYIKMLYLDICPYTVAALRYRPRLQSDTSWMRPHFMAAKIQRRLGCDYPPLVGIVMAFFAHVARLLRVLRRKPGRRAVDLNVSVLKGLSHQETASPEASCIHEENQYPG